MSLQGMPSFAEPLLGAGFQVFRPFAGVGPCALLPDALELAVLDGGRPDFEMEWVRRDDRSRQIYASLSFRVAPRYPIDRALAGIRAIDPRATLRNATFTGGFLRLVSIGKELDIPARVLTPIELVWNGLGQAAFHLELAGDAAEKVSGLLEARTLTLLAYAELELAGVAPPLPLTVTWDPAALVAALAPDPKDRRVNREALFRRLRDHRDTLPIQYDTSEKLSPDLLAEAITDLIRMRLGRFVPAPDTAGEGYFVLPDQVAPGRATTDLRTPFEARRPVVLSLNPFDAVYQLTAKSGIDSVIRRVEVPPLSFGGLDVALSATVPATDAALGAILHAPANPPLRPQAIWTDPIALDPATRVAKTTLRFSRGESPRYGFKTFCDLGSDGYFEAEERLGPIDPARLRLGPEDFPVDFLVVTLADDLARLATVRATLSWSARGATVERTAALAAREPLALCVPKEATGARLKIQASPLAGPGAPLTLELPAASLAIGATSFAEFGEHALEASCVWPSGGRAVNLDLQGLTATEPSFVRLTPESPSAPFNWYADSPFLAGYRYRLHGNREWSEPQSPFEPLRLSYDAATGRLTKVEARS